MYLHHPTDQTTGAAIGGALGFVKSLTLISQLSWISVFETALLAAIGAAVGFLVTGLLKMVKQKFFKS